MNNLNEINTDLETVGIERLSELPQSESPRTSRSKAYAVAASIALSGLLGYGVGHYTNKLLNSKHPVVQTLQPVTQPAPVIETKKETKQTDSYVFAGVRWESKAQENSSGKVWLRYDESSAQLKKKGMRHAYLWEQGELLYAGLEGKLGDSIQEVYTDLHGEWANGGVAWTSKAQELLYYPNAEFRWENDSYLPIVQGSVFVAVATNIKEGWNTIAGLGDDVSRLVYGKKVNELPLVIQKDGGICLREEGKIWPVCRGDFYYSISCYYYNGMASRGVVVKRK